VANSSDWLAAVAVSDNAAPGWLALLGDVQGFTEALPFGDMALAPVTDPAPHVTPEPEAAPEPAPEPEPDPLEAALAAAFAEGEAAGRAAAEAEAEARAVRQRALRLSFRALDEAALATLADDLAATVSALCEGVLGEAARDPDGLLVRCHAAARRIGGAAEALTLHLHPDDIALIDPETLDGWRVVADAALEPGSVVIEGPDGSVCDGPAEWRRAIAQGLRG
jgi:flagellar assembly protein FliH